MLASLAIRRIGISKGTREYSDMRVMGYRVSQAANFTRHHRLLFGGAMFVAMVMSFAGASVTSGEEASFGKAKSDRAKAIELLESAGDDNSAEAEEKRNKARGHLKASSKQLKRIRSEAQADVSEMPEPSGDKGQPNADPLQLAEERLMRADFALAENARTLAHTYKHGGETYAKQLDVAAEEFEQIFDTYWRRDSLAGTQAIVQAGTCYHERGRVEEAFSCFTSVLDDNHVIGQQLKRDPALVALRHRALKQLMVLGHLALDSADDYKEVLAQYEQLYAYGEVPKNRRQWGTVEGLEAQFRRAKYALKVVDELDRIKLNSVILLRKQLQEEAADTLRFVARLKGDYRQRAADLFREVTGRELPKVTAGDQAEAEIREEIRTWKTASGKSKIEARFIELAGGKVRLEREDGRTVRIALNKLSSADKRYVKQINEEKADSSAGDVAARSTAKRRKKKVGPSCVPGFEHRFGMLKGRAVRRAGGTAASERAVASGLAWLAAHQNNNGSWSFNHSPKDKCTGFPDPGQKITKMGATGLVLGAFLGAGHTHMHDGPYRATVTKALSYLIKNMEPKTGRLYEQKGESHCLMYSHAISAASIAEAYGMTGDRKLAKAAQLAVDYIIKTQGKDGGWRYAPKDPGDTSVVGWQMMALKSAKMAGLDVPEKVTTKVTDYLDGAQEDGGAKYRYMIKGGHVQNRSLTAIGLLCRTYLGWAHDKPPLRDGLAYLVGLGPHEKNMYYNYYGTMFMFQMGGPRAHFWNVWNNAMRDHLVTNQENKGGKHRVGSWHFKGEITDLNDGMGDAGGRVYNTAMAVMMLEVYYRYGRVYE